FTCSTNSFYSQALLEKDFTHYSILQGLSHKRVNDIAQDAYGYLWIATKRGLNRFDGSSIEHFYSNSSSNSLPQDDIAKLRWIDREQLAVITIAGLHIVNTRNMKTRNLIIPPGELKHIFKVNSVTELASDEAGNIFVLTRSGFYKFNNQDKLVFRYDGYKKSQVETETFAFGNSMAKAGNGNFLLSTKTGMCLYDAATNSLDSANKSKSPFYRQVAAEGHTRFLQADDSSFTLLTGITNELIHYNTRLKKRFSIPLPFRSFDKFDWRSRIFRLSDTLLAVTGNEKGLYLINFNPSTGKFHFNPDIYFENYYCTAVLLDHNNTLWIGTNRGLFRQNKSSLNIEKMIVPTSFNPANKDLRVNALTIANEKIFASANGYGVLIFDRKSMEPLKHIDLSPHWQSSNFTTGILTCNRDTVFVGTFGPMIWVDTKNYSTGKVYMRDWNINRNVVSSLLKDSRNNIYAANGDFKGFYYRTGNKRDFIFRNHPERFFNILSPSYISEDLNGNIWFAGAGLSRYNYQKEQFDLLLDSFPTIRTPFKQTTGAQVGKDGKIYFGLFENGLLIYDPATKKYEQLTRDNGLPDNTITALTLLGDKLWLGTESGLANFDLTTKTISSFGIDDGMPADLLTANSFYFDTAHQHLYTAFNNTIVRFQPAKLIKNNLPPRFFIESISVNGEKNLYHPARSLSLPYRQNNLVVNLGIVNFTDPYLQRFAYRLLKNGDEPWQEIGSQRNIIFSNLAASKYLLQVKVFSKNNSWTEQIKEISIIIRPPFWKTTLFIGVLIIIVLAALYFSYRIRIRQVRQKADVDKQLAQTEMKALHAQMNPHFIFNCLNSIREMILNNENEQASLYLSKFARLIRITLNHSSKPFVSLTETIDYLERYIEMEKIRSSHFTYTIEVDNSLNPDDVMVPPMLIQPFIENAIWHGSPPKKSMDIQISFRKKENELICIVDDNGIGIEESLKQKQDITHESPVGIANIRQRISLLNEKYDLRSTIRIQDKVTLPVTNGTGTTVTLNLPLKTHESLWTS
ncbi:MAG TPA: histidine kinase, partial [Chitinophagaceae bacterium]|nr:histidine kinase [Chitinophagaceae bacterium]